MYVSVVECNNYFDRDIEFYSKWDTLSEGDKRRYIYTAMDLIDNRSKWVGHTLSREQENAFPRDFSDYWDYQDDKDIYFRYDRQIPPGIKKATFEQIKELYNANYNEMFNLQKSNVKSFSDGDMSVGFGDRDTQYPGAKNRKIWSLVWPYTLMGWSNRNDRSDRVDHTPRTSN